MNIMRKKIGLMLLVMLLPLMAFSLAAADNVTYLTKKEFTEKIGTAGEKSPMIFKGGKPVIVDFTASWCPPCKKLAPILEELAVKYKGKVDIYKVDVDKEGELARAYSVRSIPMMLFIRKDGKYESLMGLHPQEDLEKKIADYLLKSGSQL